MSEEQPTFRERIKQQPLWFWGFCFMFGGVFSNLATTMLIDTGELRRAEERAAQLGAAVAGGLLILAGIVFVVLHFVRRKK